MIKGLTLFKVYFIPHSLKKWLAAYFRVIINDVDLKGESLAGETKKDILETPAHPANLNGTKNITKCRKDGVLAGHTVASEMCRKVFTLDLESINF